jgi:Carboxypeptidase regulatory-like domain
MKTSADVTLGLRKASRLLSLIFASLLLCVPLFSQGTAGRILGTVTDQSGGVVAGATVIVTDVDRNAPRTLTTGQSGEYNAPNLLPGTYKVRAEAKGFKAFERENVILEVGGELRIDLTLQPGEMTQTITVTEAVPLVETTNAELGGTLQSAIIETLPLNGRNFVNMLQLRPGVTIYPGGAGGTQSTNGQRPHDNVYMIDGVYASDPWVGQSSFNANLAAGDASTILPVDAIDEFKTEENPRAEYGWKPGAIVNVGVKSGTNDLHGSAYAYGRYTAFDARNYFNPVNGLNPTKQPVELEQYGATVGGPIKKDKLFYFANFESQRYGIGNPVAITTPTQADLIAACQTALGFGAPSPSINGTPNPKALTALSASLAGLTNSCGIDSSKNTKDPGGLTFQGLFPVNDGSAGGRVFSDLLNTNTIYGGLGKVDYRPNIKNQLEGMYFFSQGNGVAADTPLEQVSTAWMTKQHARAQVASGDWTYTPSSTLVNEVRFGYAHDYWFFIGNDSGQNPATYSFNGQPYEVPTGITNPIDWGMPGIRFRDFYGGYANNGIGITWPKILGPNTVLELLDHVSVTHGKHAFKFGGEIILNQAKEDVTANAKGPVRFASLNDFFDGKIHQANLLLGDPIRTLTNQGFAGFLQDDWRVTPRLTLNLGVRYELNTVVHDKNGQQANFDPVRGLVQSDNPYHGDHNNFAPRVGFAWDIGGNGKTVLRAAGGILYEQVSMDVFNAESNILGLRTIPTGLPLFNAGSSTPLPLNGNIQLQALTFTGPSLGPVDLAWRNFDPTKPVSAQTTLYSSVSNPACGDGINNPNPGVYLAPPAQCEIYAVDPNIRTPYVNNWNIDLQRAITNNLSVDIGYVGNHGTKLLGRRNLNQPTLVGGFSPGWGDPSAPGSAANLCLADYTNCSADAGGEQAAMPFTAPCALGVGVSAQNATPANGSGGPFNPTNACFSFLNYINVIQNIYESNYNGLQVTLTGRNYHGLSFTAGYTYSHALGMASDQGTAANFPTAANSYAKLRPQLYANTDFDIRHRFTLSFNYVIPGRKGAGQLLEGWSLNSIVVIQSGLPWGLSDQGNDFSGTGAIGAFAQSLGEQWDFFGNPSDFTPVHGFTDTNCVGPGAQGCSGGLPFFPGGGTADAPTSNATCNAKARALDGGASTGLAQAALFNTGCYAVGNSVLIPPAFGSYGTTAQNLWRDAGFKNWDMSVAKLFTIKERLKAEVRVELFNVLNHPHFSNPSGGPGGGIGDPSGGPPFGFSGLTPDTYSSNPQLGSGGNRAMQLGLKLSW